MIHQEITKHKAYPYKNWAVGQSEPQLRIINSIKIAPSQYLQTMLIKRSESAVILSR